MIKITDEKGNTYFVNGVYIQGKIIGRHYIEIRDGCDAVTIMNFFHLLDRILEEMKTNNASAEIIEMNSVLFEKLRGLDDLVFPAPKIAGESEWYIWHLKVKINEELEDDTICVHGE